MSFLRKAFLIALCTLCTLSFWGCQSKPLGEAASGTPGSRMSISKYSDVTGKNYEETFDGYKAAFYNTEEITTQRIKDWLDTCEPSGQYYTYIDSDPDSWDMYMYYAPENNTDTVYKSFSFCVVDQIVKVYVEGNKSTEKQPSEYVLIRIQAPARGAWPAKSELFIDEQPVEMSANVAFTY